MSPLSAADRIRIPVFIAHGGDDRVADSSQSRRLAKILKKAGTPHETMFEGEEGHGFYTLKNRIELYQRIEAFLKKNI
jgi:dipeptidyl aminopeptidase/acylaminoacyl peptidase